MIFEASVWLWALLLLPAVPWLMAWAGRRDQDRTARLVSRALWPRVVLRPWPRWPYVRLILITVAGAGFILALARPQWGIVREKVEREGVDVVLALDTSGSMATADVGPNRFFLARAALMSLLSRLDGDRVGLLAFEGEAYPLAPLTLDGDAVGLFLETLEPGVVPAPGSSLGEGLAKGLAMFVDKERRNKVMVLVSDGEDLEGDVDAAVAHAKEAGVIVHTVGVGTERGQPVPNFDPDGKPNGYKKDPDGSPVISHFNPTTLEAIARGTGGQLFRITPSDTSLSALASAIEGMEQKALAREYAYRKKERFQIPLAIGFIALVVALGFPLPRRLRGARPTAGAARTAAAFLALFLAGRGAGASTVTDEVLLRPKRATSLGQKEYAQGNHPESLKAFESAAALRPEDPKTKFNLADALYKSGRFDDAAALFQALGGDAKSGLAAASRFNLGNTLVGKKDYPGAIGAYRDALQLTPNDESTRKNLEMALRALQEQKKQQQQKQDQNKDQDQKKDQKQQPQPGKDDKQQQQQKPGQQPQQRPQTEQEKEQQRFQQETGMPKERAMQLLEALQQNEKEQQKKLLAEKQVRKKGSKDW